MFPFIRSNLKFVLTENEQNSSQTVRAYGHSGIILMYIAELQYHLSNFFSYINS